MSEKMSNDKLKLLISAFIVLVLAVAFIASISDQTNAVIQKTVVNGEVDGSNSCYVVVGTNVQVNGTYTDPDCNITVVNAPTDWKQEDCPLESVVVTNGTGVVLTLNTDYTLNAATGKVALLNTTANTHAVGASNKTLVSYNYCGTGYVNSSFGRTLLGTNLGFYALAILLVILAIVLLLFKNKGDEY